MLNAHAAVWRQHSPLDVWVPGGAHLTVVRLNSLKTRLPASTEVSRREEPLKPQSRSREHGFRVDSDWLGTFVSTNDLALYVYDQSGNLRGQSNVVNIPG